MKILLEVEIEMKSEHGAADNALPSPDTVAAYVKDYVRAATRPDYEVNWTLKSARVAEVL